MIEVFLWKDTCVMRNITYSMVIRGTVNKASEGLILGFRLYLLFVPRSVFDCWNLPWRIMMNHELGEDILNVFWVNVAGYTVRTEIR